MITTESLKPDGGGEGKQLIVMVEAHPGVPLLRAPEPEPVPEPEPARRRRPLLLGAVELLAREEFSTWWFARCGGVSAVSQMVTVSHEIPCGWDEHCSS